MSDNNPNIIERSSTWDTYDNWRERWRETPFILHNQNIHIEELWPADQILGIQCSHDIGKEENPTEIWFDSLWLLCDPLWSKAELVDFVTSLGADEIEYVDAPDKPYLKVWYD